MSPVLLSGVQLQASIDALAADVEDAFSFLAMSSTKKRAPNTSQGLLLTDPLHVLLYGFSAEVVTTMAAMRRMHVASGVRHQSLAFYYQERIKLDGKVEGWIEAHFVTTTPGGLPAKHTLTIIAHVEHERTPVLASLADVLDVPDHTRHVP